MVTRQGPTWPDARQRTDSMLEAVSKEVLHGTHGPRIVLGDLNHDCDRLEQCAYWRAQGWVEGQQLSLCHWNQPPQMTCKKPQLGILFGSRLRPLPSLLRLRSFRSFRSTALWRFAFTSQLRQCSFEHGLFQVAFLGPRSKLMSGMRAVTMPQFPRPTLLAGLPLGLVPVQAVCQITVLAADNCFSLACVLPRLHLKLADQGKRN